jgi:hypothetical protein
MGFVIVNLETKAVLGMGKMKDAYPILVEKSEQKRLLGRARQR